MRLKIEVCLSCSSDVACLFNNNNNKKKNHLQQAETTLTCSIFTVQNE